ncbi:hypothetical protein [Vibrio navarrensis]|uniref:hypothetical protein n=1 Tax=Vibrio navarrensis TaxID=29495 RepID=UPI001302C192|nr:hypothetical protein [Vibrio navarrensis]
MVYHVSKKYLLKKGLEPFFITLFWPLLAHLTSLIIHIDMNKESIWQLEKLSVVLFFITSFITIVRIYFLKNTVLVVDKNGVVYRVRGKVFKFPWSDLSRIRIYKKSSAIIRLDLFPCGKQLRVYFFEGLVDLIDDIEKNSKDKINTLPEFIDVKIL